MKLKAGAGLRDTVCPRTPFKSRLFGKAEALVNDHSGERELSVRARRTELGAHNRTVQSPSQNPSRMGLYAGTGWA